jgi:hypothetical protein
MAYRLLLPFALIGMLLSGCMLQETAAALDEPYPGDEHVIWVSKTVTGGKQCVQNDSFRPPDTTEMLRGYGIAVFDEDVVMLLVCAACSCPAYAAIHYALIKKTDRSMAESLGFEQDER